MKAKLITRNHPWAANRMRWKCYSRFVMTRNGAMLAQTNNFYAERIFGNRK